MNSDSGEVRPFSLLIKPAGADCNLACRYCFYLKKAGLYPGAGQRRMTRRVLERVIQSYMSTGQPVYSFGWQGGEPLLMGLEFFRAVVDLQIRYGGPDIRVANALQTNAVLLTDEWAEHLVRYRFLVGCSLDGPEDIHDRYRRTSGGGPSHASVLKGIRILERHQVDLNVLVLVSQANVKRGREVFTYLVDQGIFNHQYIPCVEFDKKESPMPYAINGCEWGNFMCAVFDQWATLPPNSVSVHNFDVMIQKLLDGSPSICSLADDCRQYFVVEYNGDLYPCDFFVEDGLKIGNVMNMSWEDAQDSRIYRQFGIGKSRLNPACKRCDSLELCMGGCQEHRFPVGKNPSELSWLCSGIQQMIRHTQGTFARMAEEIRVRQIQGRQQTLRIQKELSPEHPRPGRNAPCPCGSGLKFKKCCGR